jgi:hypothetical protein
MRPERQMREKHIRRVEIPPADALGRRDDGGFFTPAAWH